MRRDLFLIYVHLLKEGWKVLECKRIEGEKYISYRLTLHNPEIFKLAQRSGMPEDANRTYTLHPWPAHRSECVGYNPYIDELVL